MTAAFRAMAECRLLEDYQGPADIEPIKVKLTGDLALDIARIEALRTARPDAWIGVDANQGYEIDGLQALLPVLLATRVAQLEQPLARGREQGLDGFGRPLPFVADESALTLDDTPGLVGRSTLSISSSTNAEG
jgi:L-alanine-DL-glutamate epimerase-like enolase superfamily enzyme